MRRHYRIIVKGLRRSEPDAKLLAQALIRLAREQQDKAAKAQSDGEVSQ